MPLVHDLPFLGCAVKPCTEGLHVQADMNATGTFWREYVGGGDTTVYLSSSKLSLFTILCQMTENHHNYQSLMLVLNQFKQDYSSTQFLIENMKYQT